MRLEGLDNSGQPTKEAGPPPDCARLVPLLVPLEVRGYDLEAGACDRLQVSGPAGRSLLHIHQTFVLGETLATCLR